MTAFNVSMLLTAEADQARREVKETAADLRSLGQSARSAGTTAAAGLKVAENQMVQLRRTTTGATSNLVAQFNDVGQMLIAGQSPLLLAAQQGTQISQVLGPLGARGAVQALGGAFLGMLNPVNLAVFGAVAGLGLLGSALRGIFGETNSVEDALAEVVELTDALEKSTRAYLDAAAVSRVSVAELAVTYGELADRIARARDQQERMSLAQAAFDQNRVVDDLAGRAGGAALGLIGPGDIAALEVFIEKGEIARSKLAELNAFSADDRLVIDQLSALQQLADQYGITAEAALKISGASAVLGNTSGIEAQGAAAADLAEELERSFGSTQAVDAALPGVLAGLQKIVEAAGNMSAAMAASADEAARIAANFAAAQQQIAAAGKVYSGRGSDPRTSNSQGVGEFVYTGPQLDAFNNVVAKRNRAGAGRSAARQADAAQKLIASLNRELDILRATDPVQKELIRNREALAKATEAERQKVEELIATKIREEEAQRRVQDTWEFSKNAAFEALDALIVQGEKASDVMANLARSVASALLQSALLGTGPLAGIFGGQGTGLFDVIGAGLGIPAAAAGGMIFGPGGPRDDKVLARLSNGEFVVNAASTARHRPLLEAINSAPRFASGGVVGANSAGALYGERHAPLVVELRLSDDIDARIADTAEHVSVRVVRRGLEEYDAKILPRSMQAVSADPRRVG